MVGNDSFWSLVLLPLVMTTATDNQVTHCIYPDQSSASAVMVKANNIELACRRDQAINPDVEPVLTAADATRQAMLGRIAAGARAEATSWRVRPPEEIEKRIREVHPAWNPEEKARAAEGVAERLERGQRLAERTKEIQPSDWSLLGRVLDPEGKPVAGARLEISEGGKKLSEIPADDQGEFFANYSGQKFKDLFARAPQLKLTIKSADGEVLQTLDRPLVPESDRLEALELRLGEVTTSVPLPVPKPTSPGPEQQQSAQVAAIAEPVSGKAAPHSPQPAGEGTKTRSGRVESGAASSRRKRTHKPRKKDR